MTFTEASLVRDLREVVASELFHLPKSGVTIDVERDSRTEGTWIRVVPATPSAAPIEIFVHANVIFVGIGRDSTIEVAYDSTSAQEAVAGVREIVEAVVKGRFRETIWLRGEEVVRSQGQLELASGPRYTTHQASTPGSRTGGSEVRLDYDPYV
jgi:hypothetical protein